VFRVQRPHGPRKRGAVCFFLGLHGAVDWGAVGMKWDDISIRPR
jgi:hypothetical protein